MDIAGHFLNLLLFRIIKGLKMFKHVSISTFNAIFRADWLLKFLYRTLSMTTGVAGLLPVECGRVKNVDLSSIVTGHREYSEKLTELLQFVGVRTKDSSTVDDNWMKKSASAMPCTESSTLKEVSFISSEIKMLFTYFYYFFCEPQFLILHFRLTVT